jgi:hypothetical protein
MQSRVFHNSYGHGVCVSEETSGSGFKVARCVFDTDPKTERVILSAFLTSSDKPVPSAIAKAKRPRKARATAEKISDKLLVPGMEDKYASDDLTEQS